MHRNGCLWSSVSDVHHSIGDCRRFQAPGAKLSPGLACGASGRHRPSSTHDDTYNTSTSRYPLRSGMLWSRSILSRSSCAARFKRSPSQVVLDTNALPAIEARSTSGDSRSLYRRWTPQTTDRASFGRMAPKQAKLGYVKTQHTLGCGSLHSCFLTCDRNITANPYVASSSATQEVPRLRVSNRS